MGEEFYKAAYFEYQGQLAQKFTIRIVKKWLQGCMAHVSEKERVCKL